ncbi:unnamed protein product [Lactuca virosa]|uniref:PI3K/PI4K catalytic domain-containing protein n=1 Tax=Lactuca virosa TaxID=75947 RepID=A0AAU9M3X8_9ASTR|nr:unnamed protein product [Lactuca virosa]
MHMITSTVHFLLKVQFMGPWQGFLVFTVGPFNSKHAYIPIQCVSEATNVVKFTDRMWATLLASTNQPTNGLEPSRNCFKVGFNTNAGQNMIDGLGITGYEGTFLKVCEITLSVLREHRETLMSFLQTFVHGPLVEWTKIHKSSGVEFQNPHAQSSGKTLLAITIAKTGEEHEDVLAHM